MNIIVNKDISIKAFVMITIFAILIGIMCIYIATKGFINVNILKTYKKEIAEIDYSIRVNVNHQSTENDSYQRKVKYIYNVDNEQYKGEDILWWRAIFDSEKNVSRGDKITVFYNINNPAESEVYHISYVLIVVGISFIIFSILSLKQRIKEN